MTRIVTTTYKPPPKRKERKLAEITGPAVVTAKGSRRPVRSGEGSGGRGWDDPPMVRLRLQLPEATGPLLPGGRDAALAGPRHPPQAQHVLPGPLARCHAASLDPRDRGGPVTAEVAPGARFPARSTYYSL